MGLALVAGLAVGSTMGAPQAALANHSDYGRTAEARVTVDLSIRYGPSRDYYVIDVVPRGRHVDIIRCLPRRDWCEVRYGRHSGWVAAHYLYNTRYDRSYDRWDDNDLVIAFDFFANIFDWDNDRGRRYDGRRWDDDYYRNVRTHGRRGNDDWGRSHHSSRQQNSRHHGERDRYQDRNYDRGHDRDYNRDYSRDYDRDRDGRWGR